MKIQEIRELIRLIDQSNITEFEFEKEGAVVKLKKGTTYTNVRPSEIETQISPTVVVAEPLVDVKDKVTNIEVKEEPSNKENLKKVVSPMVGTFYASPSPQDPSYVKVGDRISSDTIVCIVEAMKLFNEIEAEISGEIVEVLVESGQLVEYGQPLFLVR